MDRPRDDARILLVDDEQEWLDILSLAFADEHWIVDAVSSGRDALARLRENRYDLVMCDMSMPGMTGIELLRPPWKPCSSAHTITSPSLSARTS